MGPVGGFCYFCFKRAVHGPSAGNLLQYCLRALLWDYVMALITVIQRPFAGNVLCRTDYITFVAFLYSYYCYLLVIITFSYFLIKLVI